MSDPDDADGPDLFRHEALAHRYRKHWGRIPSQSRVGATEWLALAAGAVITAGTISLISRMIGLDALVP